jgi:hypothetical protein
MNEPEHNGQQPQPSPEELTILPKTYFDELAEEGVLVEFLENYMPQQFAEDELFRERIFTIALQHKPESEDLIAERIIVDIRNALTYFLEYTNEWTNRKH